MPPPVNVPATSRLVRAAQAFAVGAVAAAAAAAPAEAWEPPEQLSARYDFIHAPRLAETRSGNAFAGWDRQRGIRDRARAGVDVATRRADSWSRARSLGSSRAPAFVALADLDAYAASRAVALTLGGGTTSRLRAAYLTRSGRVARVERLDATLFISNAQAAFAGDGAAVAAWTHRSGRGGSRIHVAFRPAGRSFRRLGSVSSRGANSAAVAMRGGRAAVAWQRRGRLEARISRDGGAHWGRVIRVGRAMSNQTRISIAVSVDGAVALAWLHQRMSEGGEPGPAVYEARLRPAGEGFGRRIPLERHDAIAPFGRQAAEVAFVGERAVVAWQGLARPAGPDTGSLPVFAVRAGELAANRVDAVATLSADDRSAVLDDVAIQEGRIAVAWRAIEVGDDGALGEVWTSVASDGAAGDWGAAERVSPAGQPAGEAQLDWDADGRLRAVWRARTGVGTSEAVYAARR